MNKLAKFIALGFGSGLPKYAPGTFGTLAAVVIVAVTSPLPYALRGALFVLLLVGGTWAADRYEKLTGKVDAHEVVIDEIAAYYMIFLFYPVNIATLIMGFVMFRLFDITKPYPIKKLEKIEGGLGVMADDLLAAVYAMLTMIILYNGYQMFFAHM